MALAPTDSHVVIDGETFDIVAIPDANSKMVQNAKNDFLGSLDLQSLVDDLGKLGNFIRVAYNGVAGNIDVQIKVQRVGYKITKLADKSAVTVHQFKGASQSVLEELKGTYQYLLDGLEEMAQHTFSKLTDVAKEMEKAARELRCDFQKATDDVTDALEGTQKAKGDQEVRRKTREEERKEFESKVKQAEQVQKNALEAEVNAQALYNAAQARENKAMHKQNNLLGKIVNAITGVIVAAAKAATGDIEAASQELQNICDNTGDKEAMKMANQEKMKHLDELQKERELRQKAIIECIEFAEKIKSCQDDDALAEAAIEALHSSIGALKSLSVIMMNAANFWQEMQSHCASLAKKDIQQSVETAMKYPEKKRLKVWTSRAFKETAVRYYSQWVALDDVCGVYMLQIRNTTEDLHKYLEENPTIEQAKKNVRQLASEFAKDLKQAQEKLAEDNQKALEEKKSLEGSE